MKKILLSILAVLTVVVSFAQGQAAYGEEDIMTGHLKIYVVVTVLSIILALIFVFLFALERRLKELESKQKRG